ncbi:MAG: hypothetical protein AB8C95_15700, partial [Phycisphaeraceae bacterium]
HEAHFQGRWLGTYRYNLETLNEHFGHVPFTMSLQDIGNETFEGWIEDDVEQGGTPGTGTISGKLKGKKISWKKQMPIMAVIDKNGESSVVPDKKHIPLIYSGTLDEDGKRAHGKWRFGGVRGLFNVKGTWSAEFAGPEEDWD